MGKTVRVMDKKIHHEPDNTDCGCALKRIDEDVSEKLDYTPDVFTVERHIRGKWVVHNGSTIGKELDYSLKRWTALSRYLDDEALLIDNNWCENQIRPWALGRKNWLFAGSLRSGKRASTIMSLIQSARNNGHDPYYLKDVLTRLSTQRASEIAELLPHRWRPA